MRARRWLQLAATGIALVGCAAREQAPVAGPPASDASAPVLLSSPGSPATPAGAYAGQDLRMFNLMGAGEEADAPLAGDDVRDYRLSERMRAFAVYSRSAQATVVLVYDVGAAGVQAGEVLVRTREAMLEAYLVRDAAAADQPSAPWVEVERFLALSRRERRRDAPLVWRLEGDAAVRFAGERAARVAMALQGIEPVTRFEDRLQLLESSLGAQLSQAQASLRPQAPAAEQRRQVAQIQALQAQLDQLRAQRKSRFRGPALVAGEVRMRP